MMPDIKLQKDISYYTSVHSLQHVPALGLPEICISGRSNVGKSSLINRLANKRNMAKTSQIPGKTRSLNYYLVDRKIFLVDLPGYGYAKVGKSEKAHLSKLVNSYLNDRTDMKYPFAMEGLIQLLDSRHGPVSGDTIMLDWIKEWGGNVLYVFTKADKLSASDRAKLKRTYGKELGLDNITMFSANTGMGEKNIWSWINRTVRLE